MKFFQKLWCKALLLLLSILLPGYVNQLQSQVLKPPPFNRPIDVIGNKFYFIKGFPDTLIMGQFIIITEEYDKGGNWDEASKTYQHLNGIGRVQFSCQKPLVFPWAAAIWKDAVMKPVLVKVVDSVVDNNQLTVNDAALLGLKTQVGTQVELMLPHYADKAVDLSRYLTDVLAVKKPEGIRVRFTDITVKAIKQGASRGAVLAGIARYPSDPPIPEAPFRLNVAPGFQLEVSALVISPIKGSAATARLILPPSLSQDNNCEGAALDLGSIALSPKCEFYKELPDSNYGVFNVGATTLGVAGRGYVVDFSSALTYAPVAKPAAWKGVVLLKGDSKGSPVDSVISNIGYLQAPYAFTLGLVESTGLSAVFNNTAPYRYGTTQPFGYTLAFATAQVTVAASQVSGGFLRNGTAALPRSAVRQANDASITLTQMSMVIRPSMDLMGFALILPNIGLYWGDLIAAGGGERKSFGIENISREAILFFSAKPRPVFQPVSGSGKTFANPLFTVSPGVIDSFSIQGATFFNFSVLVVNAPDIPGNWRPNDPVMPWNNSPVRFMLTGNTQKWLNVMTEGVNCNIAGDIGDAPPGLKLGDPSKPLYVGIDAFQTQGFYANKTASLHSTIVLQCVESSVITCNFSSFVKEPAPVNSVLAFKEMVFTSTANNAGGKLAIGANDSLSYWGLKLVQKPGFSASGLVSVKTGQIILTAAGLSEERHFAQPFWVNWGEILANGSVGRLFFDFNSAGQQFDKFNFVHSAVALSPFDPTAKGFLRVGGMAHFPFFGGDYLHIQDIYDPTAAAAPFNSRIVKLSSQSMGSFLPTNPDIAGNWQDGLGIFNFKLAYNAVTQDGFIGNGKSALRNLLGGDIGSTLDMNSRGTCMRIGSNLMDQRSIALGPVANISNITRIWGCACVKDDAIENLVVGGEVTNAANVSVAARVGSYLSAIMQVTPAQAKITIDGEAYMSLALSLDAVVNGHMQLTMNTAEGFLEGEVQGKLRVAEGAVLVGSSLEAEGQVNWHLGADFQELQGMVSLSVMHTGGGTGVGAGFYIGHNAPKSRAWVLIGNDPRFNLNTAALPDNLTGVYGSIHIHQGVNLYVVSGDYDLYLGLGAFVLTPGAATQLGGVLPAIGLPYVVGNLGGRIHGDILGGLVSAGAYFDMQVIGPYPFSFEGTVGLEGCVLWVFCGSVDVSVGLNSSQGFYIR